MDSDVTLDHRFGTELTGGSLLARFGEARCGGGIIQHLIDRLGEECWIRRRNQSAGDSIFDHFRDATHIASDDGAAGAQSIENAGTESFLETGMNVEIERGQPRCDIFLETDPVHPLLDAQLLRTVPQRLVEFSVTDQYQMGSRLAIPKLSHRLHQMDMSLVFLQGTH